MRARAAVLGSQQLAFATSVLETPLTRELADGKLLVDEPRRGCVRLTISNAEKRNALDHPILDAITATLGEHAGPEGASPRASWW